MKIACFADHDYYADHLFPIWKQLSPEVRGPFFTRGTARRVVKYKDNGNIANFIGKVLTASWGNHKFVTQATGRSHPSMPHGSGGNGSAKGCNLWTNSYKAGNLDFWMTVSPYGEISGIPHLVIDGMPKLDNWVGYKPSNKQKTIAISFRWRESQSAFDFYAQHLKNIVKQLKKDGWRILGHGHPLKEEKWHNLWQNLGVQFVSRFDLVLKDADVYACDNSGTIWEWASLDRPVVILNAPKYEGLERIPRFSSYNQVGLHCNNPLDLPELANVALSEPEEIGKRRRQILKSMYGTMDGKASVRAAKLLEDFYT